jgi:hypothetical protein
MIKFVSWCATTDEQVKKIHLLRTLNADPKKLQAGIEALAKVVPTHYASEERLAGVLKRLGKLRAAKFLQSKLPSSKSIRSGDLGEILAASYVQEMTTYGSVISRLRWKDHRNMAMRGDDVIAVQKAAPPDKIKFLKGEAKSSVAISAAVIAKGRKALRKDKNRPSAHALSFLADRLHEQGKKDLANLIDDAQYKFGIKLRQVAHLLFTFSGNDARPLLLDDLGAYTGSVEQHAVALVVKDEHQKFIKRVYEQVIQDGVNN